MNHRSPLALTNQHPSPVRVLRNRIFVSEAFDPANPPDPQPFKDYIGLWDTGASNSVITEKVVNELGLSPTGKTTVYHADGETPDVNTFLVNIVLPNKVLFAGTPVTIGKLRDTDVLIGMDIIAAGDFAITRRNGGTLHTFQFPSTHSIDFVEEINAHTQIPSKKVGRNDKCPCGSGKKYKQCHGRNG